MQQGIIMKNSLYTYLLLTIFSVGLVGCGQQEVTPSAAEPIVSDISENEFVSVQGTQFMWRGKPYYVVGTNFWFGGYLGAEGELGDRERLGKELDLLQATGINNLRVLAVSESSELMR